MGLQIFLHYLTEGDWVPLGREDLFGLLETPEAAPGESYCPAGEPGSSPQGFLPPHAQVFTVSRFSWPQPP